MTVLQLLDHFLNFVAPAAFLALALPPLGRWMQSISTPKSKLPAPAASAGRQSAAVLIVCLLAQGASLYLTGRDGKMLGYGLMVLSGATCQWLLMRGWRR